MTLPSLAGYVVGVTADRRADDQTSLLTRQGAEVIHGPMLRTHVIGPDDHIARCTRDLIDHPPNLVILLTGTGTRSWINTVDTMQLAEPLLSALSGVEIWTRGPKTTGAAVTLGLDVTWSHPSGSSAHLVEELARTDLAGRRVVVQHDGSGWSPVVEALVRLGATVVAVQPYEWALPEDREPALRLIRAVAEGRVDAVTFTSRPAVDNFFILADAIGLADVCRSSLNGRVRTVCVGPITGEAAQQAGIDDPLITMRGRLGSMVREFGQSMQLNRREFSLAGHPLAVQGKLLIFASGEQVALTERERGVLDMLTARPGVVISKRQLLEGVWGDAESDDHVAEVTVGRLRRRLGPAADGLETVFKRGYRLAV